MFKPDTIFLIVDDSLTTRNLLVKQLTDLGFSRFWHAANGEEAWNCLMTAQNPPIGVIFCDWNMPSMNGLDLLKKVRGHSDFKTLPFIMVTSERLSEKVKMAIQEGVSNYLVKPFDIQVIKEKLQRTYEALKQGSQAAA